MKVLIIEDEHIASDKLRNLIHQIDSSIIILGQIDSIEDTIEWFEKNDAPDLILLDIHLADGSSFEIFEQIDVSSPIIFTTAYDQYAIQAFKTKSIDYLLKPIKLPDLKRAFQKFHDIFQQNESSNLAVDYSELARLMSEQQKVYKSRFLIKVGNTIKTILVTHIAYFVFEDRINLAVTRDGHRYPVKQSLDELEEVLDPLVFCRANRQYVININSIHQIHPWFKGRLKLELDPLQKSDLVVSAEKTKSFKAWLDQ